MAQTQKPVIRPNNNPTSAEVAANLKSNQVVVTRTKRKTIDEIAPMEVTIQNQIASLIAKKKTLDKESAEFVALASQQKTLSAELRKLTTARILPKRVDGLETAIRVFKTMSETRYDIDRDLVLALRDELNRQWADMWHAFEQSAPTGERVTLSQRLGLRS